MVKQGDEERRGATEQRILDAAHAVFLRTGTAGARMQEIAREAGVNSALLHYYFRSKDRLAEAVFHRAAAQLLPAVVGVLVSDRPLADKVRAFVAIELDRLSRTPYLPGYIISELAHHPERITQLLSTLTGSTPDTLGRKLRRILGRQINAEVRAGRMRRIAPEQFMVNLLSLCVFPFAARPMIAALMGFDDRAFARFIRERREGLPEFFLSGLRP
jgi:AcrR family transcriptional regulator